MSNRAKRDGKNMEKSWKRMAGMRNWVKAEVSAQAEGG